eukprot:GHUV01003978.1.p1 GENE.GHUV01003978.1~~GHUV01003978.1.p1  ORF type:complete len:114 (+),score=18.73 GHUV01003978.1:842-1183(+)
MVAPGDYMPTSPTACHKELKWVLYRSTVTAWSAPSQAKYAVWAVIVSRLLPAKPVALQDNLADWGSAVDGDWQQRCPGPVAVNSSDVICLLRVACSTYGGLRQQIQGIMEDQM